MIGSVHFFLFLAPVLAGLAQTDEKIDTLGKSDAEILRMGGAKWSDYYTSKTNRSTAAYNEAWELYGDLASKRNAKEIGRLSPQKQKPLKLLDTLLANYSSDIVDVARGISGGGTMWNTAAYSGIADAEVTIYFVLHPGQIKAHGHPVVSQVEKQLDKLPVLIDKIDYSPPDTPSKSDLKKQVAQAKVLYRRITAIAANFPRNASDQILGFCLDQADTAVQQGQ